ncbi:MAG: response regulator transcription factor [Anaerolineales bacterium]
MNNVQRILVIDDEVTLRTTMTRVFQSAGWQVQTAANGEESLTLLERQPFDLAYLDLRLPTLDGIEVLKQIRAVDQFLPVVVLTGHGSLNSAIQALRLGAKDYLLKPIDPQILLARTRVLLQERAIEQRRAEIQVQIQQLSAELHELDRQMQAAAEPFDGFSDSQERFCKAGEFTLDLQACRAVLGARVLEIAPTSFQYLVVLAQRSPQVVGYQELVQAAQNFSPNPIEARELAKWHIHVLRQAIELNPSQPRYLLNVRGKGYRLLITPTNPNHP